MTPDLDALERLLSDERDAYKAIASKPGQIADGLDDYLDKARSLNGVLRVAAPALIALARDGQAALARVAELEAALRECRAAVAAKRDDPRFNVRAIVDAELTGKEREERKDYAKTQAGIDAALMVQP